MEAIWNDPAYITIVQELVKENPICEYCGEASETAHHDHSWMYKSRDEYYRKENMTPICHTCHHMYRRGYVICPTCKKEGRRGYMVRGAERCSIWHRTAADGPAGKKARVFKKAVVHGEWKRILR